MLGDRLKLLGKSVTLLSLLGFGDRRAYTEWKEQLGRLRDTLAHGGSLLDEERDPVRAIELFDSVRRFAEKIWAAPDSSEESA
jgi:hypothetical protein